MERYSGVFSGAGVEIMANNAFEKSSIRHVRGVFFSVVLGFFGGITCGAAILSLCGLCGRSQTTGAEYVGYWNIGLVLVGAMYGGPLGAIMGPLAYATLVRTIGFKKALVPAIIGTIAGGFAGSLVTPGLGVLTGIAGFFVALLITRYKHIDRVSRQNPTPAK